MTKESQLSVQDGFDKGDAGKKLKDLEDVDDGYEDSYENLEDYGNFEANGEPDDLEHTINNSN